MEITAHTIFCDDVRMETSGKHILVGVYDGQMQMNNGPGNVPLSLWIQIFGLDAGEHLLSVIAEKHDDSISSEIARAEVELVMPEPRSAVAITLPGVPTHIDRNCVLKIVLQLDGSEPIDAGSLTVIAAFPNRRH